MGGMSGWAMNDRALYGAGTDIAGFKDEASTAGSKLRTAVESAHGAVHHAKLTAALGRFQNEWGPETRKLPTAVANAGTSVKNAAVTGRQSDNEAASEGRRTNEPTLQNRTRVRNDVQVPG